MPRKEKIPITIHIPKDLFNTAESLRDTEWWQKESSLTEGNLAFYMTHTSNQSSWFGFLIMLGCMQFKKMLEEEKAKREGGEKTG
ncbi:hypothetical protein MUP79_07230 [Candidatus Bathyarchaeota archaeon]|nr:hypothetical protein [Candidatus Bathyarchaeota archaeon]